MGRKTNRQRALELAAKFGADKKGVKVQQGYSLEDAESNRGKAKRRFQQNLRS